VKHDFDVSARNSLGRRSILAALGMTEKGRSVRFRRTLGIQKGARDYSDGRSG